ncbi:glycosyltransferase [Candidatus Woesearchaeota archaeon]|nr:glycosyltransferase [Candidatus Woesearchaeota archaeon]
MKILFICENYYPHLGGAEVVFKNLAEGYVKRGHQVTVLTHQLQGTKKGSNPPAPRNEKKRNDERSKDHPHSFLAFSLSVYVHGHFQSNKTCSKT